MPGPDAEPARIRIQLPTGGVWDESSDPFTVGTNGGLTACNNMVYRRYGSWGKRTGTSIAYSQTIPTANAIPQSGIRWAYGNQTAFPTTARKGALVVSIDRSLYVGGDPPGIATGSDLPTNLGTVVSATRSPSVPLTFAPAESSYGFDELIIAGGDSTTLSFASGQGFLEMPVFGSIAVGKTISLTVTIGMGIGEVYITGTPYTVLASDTVYSIATAVCAAFNAARAVSYASGQARAYNCSEAWVSNDPGLGVSEIGQIINVASALGGAGDGTNDWGNGLTYYFTVGGTTGYPTTSPNTATNMTGGGAVNAIMPLRVYENASGTLVLDGLSAMAQSLGQSWTGCVNWHDHIWYWGSSQNPDALYASDINNPEGFVYMIQQGPYLVGPGDGSQGIITCVPIGNILYVFKTDSIYAVTGYDFQTGEYSFSIEPAIFGQGVPAPGCVTVLRNALVFWNGSQFRRLASGAFETETLSPTIPMTCGRVAGGNPQLMSSCAGDFQVATNMTDVCFPPPGVFPYAYEIYSNCAYFACDVGRGVADTIIVYDDDASAQKQNYAWTQWTGVPVGAFIPFGGSENAAGTGIDKARLYFLGAPTSQITTFDVYLLGGNPTSDYATAINAPSTTGIPFSAQTGWFDGGTFPKTKRLHEVWVGLSTTPGCTMSAEIVSAGLLNGPADTVYPPKTITFPASVGTAGYENYQVYAARVNPELPGKAFLLQFSEASATASYEIVNSYLDYIEEAFAT